MTKYFCDDCGKELSGQWWHGAKFGRPELDLCGRCYKLREEVMARDKRDKQKAQASA